MVKTLSSDYCPAPRILELARETPDYKDASAPKGAPFYDPVEPADFPKAIIRYRNQKAATSIGLNNISDAEWVSFFKGFNPLPDNLPNPLAIRYHGHQFRHYNPDIGDGRGFLYAQVKDNKGRLLDLGTKGSGQTPYSRSGDGRLTLKGGFREILATEMLEALGVNTSKTLSIIETGEELYRSDEPSPARSCVMVRLSHSHIRFGMFQRLAHERNTAALDQLLDYCIKYYFPDLTPLEGEDRVYGFFERVIRNTADLAAQWMAAGFVHGVLNTDNMNITGESFDYGPWRFIPTPDPNFTAAYFDQTGLYAYGRQGEAAGWNLAQLGGTLTLLSDPEKLTQLLQHFPALFNQALENNFLRRLGLKQTETKDGETISGETSHKIAMPLLQFMAAHNVPFEQFMFDWYGGHASKTRQTHSPLAAIYGNDAFLPIKQSLEPFEPIAPNRLDHPYFGQKTPCTMLIDEVEDLWAAIATGDDWQPFTEKLNDIKMMGEAYGFSE